MTKKIFKAILSVATLVLLASILFIMGVLYDHFGSIQNRQLSDELDLAAISVSEDGTDFLEQVKTERYRITWIASDGTVIYDTKNGAASMENHKDREEVKQALENGKGESTRYSSTLMEKTKYFAKKLDDGSVLRISADYASLGLLLIGMLQSILLILVVALILSGVLASRLSKRIVEPFNKLDLEQPLENETYEELAPLLKRIDRQRKEIAKQLELVQQKTDEFNQITENMNEGLILLDKKGIVLSINPKAQKIFRAEENTVGSDFLNVDRSHDMSIAIETAMKEGHKEICSEREGRDYQFRISRIESAGEVLGAVILGFDITEQESAERNRREFTANVSHELKTPLQGIIGSADLIETGMVKAEDMSRFIGHIRKEATRLLALIEDIIRLSQLDEGNEMPCEKVDVYSIAEEVQVNLQNVAEEKNVTLSLAGNKEELTGVRRLLYEIIYNLCDNAIKYNLEGGSVTVTIGSDDQNVIVTVKDTGIGIAPEYKDRVFERFYRVDKSHSKASGGTGLGLSIVKHAVLYHQGRIHLQSDVGKGTTIEVTLPKNRQ